MSIYKMAYLSLGLIATSSSMAQDVITTFEKAHHSSILNWLQMELVTTGTVAGITEGTDTDATNYLLNIDIVEVQQAAFEPYRTQMCGEVEKETPDILLAAQIFDAGVVAEANAVSSVFEDFSARLSNDGTLALKAAIDSPKWSVLIAPKVDWVETAKNDSDHVIRVFRRACNRYESRTSGYSTLNTSSSTNPISVTQD